MVPTDFKEFIDEYIKGWENFSLSVMEKTMAPEYAAREITPKGEILDFGYQQSLTGWEQAFTQLRDNAEWNLTVIGITPLRNDEIMAVITASLIIDGEPTDNANLFFQTFKKIGEKQTWKLIRSYIEAGIPAEQIQYTRWG